jgi:hypothetical protein
VQLPTTSTYPYNNLRNDDAFRISSLGKDISCSTLKCLSLLTIKSALQATAQSTNLLSSGSDLMRYHLKYLVVQITFGAFSISCRAYSVSSLPMCLVKTSSYSARISVVTQRSYLSAIKASKIGRNLDFGEMETSNTLVSSTTLTAAQFSGS